MDEIIPQRAPELKAVVEHFREGRATGRSGTSIDQGVERGDYARLALDAKTNQVENAVE